jgi:sugar lactone lactonase YvrE
MKLRRWLILATLLLLVAYLAAWPVPVDPVRWEPPAAPSMSGDYRPNQLLARTEYLARGVGVGPEAIAIDREGRVYSGLQDGRIIRLPVDGARAETIVNTGGRPLGMAFGPDGSLFVADAVKGLMSISPSGALTVLATEEGGQRFGFPDDVDVAQDGTIYFSDASFKFGLGQHRNDVLEHRPNGRLLSYDPRTKNVGRALGGLYFANGVAVSGDQSFVLVCETSAYRVTRLWRSGPKKGSRDVFIDNLPGFPDNITFSPARGVFWLALFAPRDAMADRVMPHPGLRKLIYRLPQWLQPAPARYAFALGIDLQGRVIHNLQDPSPQSFAPVTSVREHRGVLYLGSLERDAIGRVPAP